MYGDKEEVSSSFKNSNKFSNVMYPDPSLSMVLKIEWNSIISFPSKWNLFAILNNLSLSPKGKTLS